MTTLKIKTSGANPSYPQKFEFFNRQEIANAIQQEISGYNSDKANKIDQNFCDENEIVAKYASGTFLCFKISSDTEDNFSAL